MLSTLPFLKGVKNFEHFLQHFLGPRGPLRTPLVSVVPLSRCPSSATKIHATSHYSFPSDSKLILFLFQTLSLRNLSHSTQYTEHWTWTLNIEHWTLNIEHWTLNIENSRTFLAQFDLVSLTFCKFRWFRRNISSSNLNSLLTFLKWNLCLFCPPYMVP